MAIGAKRAQSLAIIARMIKENPDVTAEAIVAAHKAEMYIDNPRSDDAARRCYQLTLKECEEQTKGAPALISKRGAKKAADPAPAGEAPADVTQLLTELKDGVDEGIAEAAGSADENLEYVPVDPSEQTDQPSA